MDNFYCFFFSLRFVVIFIPSNLSLSLPLTDQQRPHPLPPTPSPTSYPVQFRCVFREKPAANE